MIRATILAAACALVLVACGTTKHASAPATHGKPVVARHVRRDPVQWHVRAAVTGHLPAPLQDAAPAPAGSHAVLLGGLTAADTSSDQILDGTARGATVTGTLPSALHDAAAATLGSSTYLFGGGNGVAQLDQIVRAPSAVVGRLPAPSSDQTGTSIGSTAYVVGGYTGTAWLNTIVAFDPTRGARVVGRLPVAVRYAAVAAAHGTVVVAGGSLPAGTASTAVYAWKPGEARARKIATLPTATTHATAAAIGGLVYVIGGRSATLDTPMTQILAVDPAKKTVRPAGSLPQPLSDASAAAIGKRIVVFGGRTTSGTTDTIVSVVQAAPSRHATVRVPALVSRSDVYAADRPNELRGAARTARDLVYVPNSLSNTVDVIDPHTYRIVEHFAVGALPQHVTPSYDLKTLYVLNDDGNSLTTIDPQTGKPGRTIPVDDPYNMYFTPDGRYAIVVAERLHRLDFRDAHTFALHKSLAVPCAGVDHMDFSADGSYAIASCEFSSELLKIDIATESVTGVLHLPRPGMPQDVKLSPDGQVFYVADMQQNGLWEIDGARLKVIGFLPTGTGAHGLYPSRDSKYLYVSNRGAGTISVVSFRTRKVVRTWTIPGGGSPDMGGVSADGKVLWLSGRYSSVVYAIRTTDGKLLAKIPVGAGPHGLCVWPQPGRYSLGHTGILR